MQNKANSLNVQMNVTNSITVAYENKRLCCCEKNKPKQSQTKPNLSAGRGPNEQFAAKGTLL